MKTNLHNFSLATRCVWNDFTCDLCISSLYVHRTVLLSRSERRTCSSEIYTKLFPNLWCPDKTVGHPKQIFSSVWIIDIFKYNWKIIWQICNVFVMGHNCAHHEHFWRVLMSCQYLTLHLPLTTSHLHICIFVGLALTWNKREKQSTDREIRDICSRVTFTQNYCLSN